MLRLEFCEEILLNSSFSIIILFINIIILVLYNNLLHNLRCYYLQLVVNWLIIVADQSSRKI